MTERIYTVNWTQPCPECKGTGRVDHPAWVALRAAVSPAEWEAMHTMEAIAAKMTELGFPCTSTRRESNWGSYIDTGVPTEEIPCYLCEGEGTLTGTCDLRVALAALEKEKVS